MLLLFHCETNAGFAMSSLESVFHGVARAVVGTESRIHYAYSSLKGGHPAHLPDSWPRLCEVGYTRKESFCRFGDYLRKHHIRTVLAFDLPIAAPVNECMREAGVDFVVSYWGAPISSVYPIWMRPLRRAQLLLARSRPDHFVFESAGMRDGAIRGSMIPPSRTSVVRVGVDTEKFRPRLDDGYLHSQFDIPRRRRVVLFSGHMEERKGVHVLISAMHELVVGRGVEDVHLLLLGDAETHEARLREFVRSPLVADRITFGGYRNDVARIHAGVSFGAIASVGWDSFTLSAAEMAASGLPLIVSDMVGLREAVVSEETGYRFPVGNASVLADRMQALLNDEQLRLRFGLAARDRAVREFSRDRQIGQLASLFPNAVVEAQG